MPPRQTAVRWFIGSALALSARAAEASLQDLAPPLFTRSLLAFGVLLAAGMAHWGIRRLGRRLPRRLARRRVGAEGRVGDANGRLERTLQVVLLPAKLGVWVAAGYYVSTCFPAVDGARDLLLRVIDMSLSAPLFTMNQRAYSAVDLLTLPALLAVLWIAVGLLTRVLRSQVLGSIGVERGVEEAVALVIRSTLTFLGAIVLLQVWGVDVSSLTIVASVLGVGIGFGLQNIANNFVSGVVLNLERPIRPGDFVHVGELAGTVERVGARCTEIRTLDQVTILVPNSRLLENEVVNWTHRDPVSRLHLPVGVAYGSDIRSVRAALLEAARSHPGVLGDPRPRVELRGFGESALDFELLVWTDDPRAQNQLKSDLNYRIEANLRRHNIQIPFPQRDLHLRSPHLDQLVAAWGRRNFSEVDLAAHAPEPKAANGEDLAAWSDDLDDREPRSWAAAEIDALVGRMRGPEGVPIHDRRHLLTVYAKCLVGGEAVEWLTRRGGLTRKEAVEFGQLLVDRDIIHHVLDEHGFKDGNLFYRFYADERS